LSGCGKPVADESTKFCSNCGLKILDSPLIEKDRPGSASIQPIVRQTESPVPGKPVKKRSTLEWIFLLSVGAVLVFAALIVFFLLIFDASINDNNTCIG
jgi:hypothetical protein